ncbi:capsule biosynthesis GfcC family protein [Dyella amyloliquefaciens]|uniref:capsule biosynthesis GfcC family protein n=1 Tax=Dyella amyloliquefaciens TaxID=1770545 RepID=UPI001E57110D|nr:capsule biosynthesis GfcC family protein [Dyella amyloliquefaciens]
MTPRLFAAVMCAALLGGFSCAASATQVELRGAVDTTGSVQLPAKARLSDAALAAHVRTDAYMAGAAWLRLSLMLEQQRAKAGLLFDLDSVKRQAFKGERDNLAQLAATLATWLNAMPVTGRQVALLDPRAVEVNAQENRPVGEGDTLYYPRRPSTIRVVGAVLQPCDLPLVALQDARRYLADCKPSPEADADWMYVIQPDGRVIRQGIALWNRSAPVSLAPGAILYVPIIDRHVSAVAPDLNSELAAFLATQLLADPEAHR